MVLTAALIWQKYKLTRQVRPARHLKTRQHQHKLLNLIIQSQARMYARKREHKIINGILWSNKVERLAFTTEYCRTPPRTMTEHRTTREKVKLMICDVVRQRGAYEKLIGIPVPLESHWGFGGNPWRERERFGGWREAEDEHSMRSTSQWGTGLYRNMVGADKYQWGMKPSVIRAPSNQRLCSWRGSPACRSIVQQQGNSEQCRRSDMRGRWVHSLKVKVLDCTVFGDHKSCWISPPDRIEILEVFHEQAKACLDPQ